MKLTNFETASFCRSLQLLLHAGVTLADGVQLLSQEESGELEKILKIMGTAMDAGSTLSSAMEQTNAFPASACAMVAIGEETGALEVTLSHLADYYDRRHRSSKQIQNAVAYPALLLLLMLGVIFVLLAEVLPVFQSVYASLGGELTGLSGGLFRLGQILKELLPVLLVILAVFAAAALVLRLSPQLRETSLRRFNRRFGDRGLLRKFQNARFARGLAMGISSGLSPEETLELAKKLLEDVPSAQARCEQCAEGLRQGVDFSQTLQENGLLSGAGCRMLAVGLRGGNADAMLQDIATRMEEEAEEALNRAVSRLEPAMVLTASLLVGGILLSVMLPLMDIMSTIG